MNDNQNFSRDVHLNSLFLLTRIKSEKAGKLKNIEENYLHGFLRDATFHTE